MSKPEGYYITLLAANSLCVRDPICNAGIQIKIVLYQQGLGNKQLGKLCEELLKAACLQRVC
jgi:hypothetical protein